MPTIEHGAFGWVEPRNPGDHVVRARRQKEPTKPVRVLLCVRHRLERQAMAAVLSAARTLRLVGEVGGSVDALRWTLLLKPDVVLLDDQLTPLHGVHPAAVIQVEVPTLKLVLLSDGPPHTAYRCCLDPRTATCISKRETGEALVELLLRVNNGEHPDGMTSPAAIDRQSSIAHAERGLTAPEVKLLRLLTGGISNRELAHVLGCTERSICGRLTRLYAKLKVRNRTEAAIYAFRWGLIAPMRVGE